MGVKTQQQLEVYISHCDVVHVINREWVLVLLLLLLLLLWVTSVNFACLLEGQSSIVGSPGPPYLEGAASSVEDKQYTM